MSPHSKEDGMAGEYEHFAQWLRQRAAQAGYDLNVRGTISRLAEDSGIDRAQMSRYLRGEGKPAIEGQRGLAKALKVKLPVVMVHTGDAQPEDFDPVADADLEAVAEQLGVPEQHRAGYVRMMRAMAELTQTGLPADVVLTVGDVADSISNHPAGRGRRRHRE